MRISIGCDHKGYLLKKAIIEHLNELKIDVIDFGTHGETSVDYPDFSYPTVKAVINKVCDFAILICYTGIGMSIAANKVNGIRAALLYSEENALLTRMHNDANCLCLGAKDINLSDAIKIVDSFIKTTFEGGRHISRVEKIRAIEDNEG